MKKPNNYNSCGKDFSIIFKRLKEITVCLDIAEEENTDVSSYVIEKSLYKTIDKIFDIIKGLILRINSQKRKGSPILKIRVKTKGHKSLQECLEYIFYLLRVLNGEVGGITQFLPYFHYSIPTSVINVTGDSFTVLSSVGTELPTIVDLQYGIQSGVYTNRVVAEESPIDESMSVTFSITGLNLDTAYYYKLRAKNIAGAVFTVEYMQNTSQAIQFEDSGEYITFEGKTELITFEN